VVLVEALPLWGEGIEGVYFLDTDLFAADALPFYAGTSFLPADLLGVYFRIFPTVYLTSPTGSADFFTYFPLAFEAAFFFPFAPPFTFGALGYESASFNFFKASFPFSCTKIS